MDFNFIFSEQEANVILTALGELPAKVANPVINSMQQQARQQLDNLAKAEEQLNKQFKEQTE